MNPTGPVVCFGEMLLRLSPECGTPLAQANRLELNVGGAEANVAVALASLGRPARMLTVLPDSPLGRRALAALRGAGVDTAFVTAAPGRMGLYYFEPPAGPRPGQVAYDRAGSAFAEAEAAQFDFAAALHGAALLHMSGITPALGPKGCALAEAAVAAASEFSGEGGERRREAAEAAFAAFPRLETIASTSRQVIDAGHHRLAARVDRRDGGWQTEELPISGIVDRIGTGDAFAAGVLHRLLAGADAREAAQSGLALAALKHGISGDMTLLHAGELDAFHSGGADVRR